MPETARGTECRYFAFLSYSRKDSDAARWLQRRLEWFRFPVKLVPQEHRPPHPSHIRPVYRDRTNLEVDHAHYWHNIKTALEQSRFLIILCSPHAAASGPVDTEVRHFLASHGQQIESLAPVILSGSVASNNDQSALCPALTELGEAITSRNLPTMIPDAGSPKREGWENGFISLVSYLLHIRRGSLSDHIRREQRRQTVRNRALAFGFAVLACAAIAAGIIALQQRDKARENEARAIAGLKEASRSDTATAQQRLADGKWQEAVAYLGRAIRYDPDNRHAQEALWLAVRHGNPDAGRLPRSEVNHEDSVESACFSPYGTRILTASDDHTAQMWDADTGQPAGQPMKHSGSVNLASFSPDGTLIITASDDQTAQIWNAKTGQPLTGPVQHRDGVKVAAFSPDGTHIVTASSDHIVQVRESLTGNPIGAPMEFRDPVTDVKFSPDSTRIVIASNHTTQVRDAKTGQSVGRPILQAGSTISASFSPDGARIVTASDNKVAQIWDAQTGEPAGKEMAHRDTVLSATFSPDGTLIATASIDKTARVWDAKTGEEIGRTMNHGVGVRSASFSPDGGRIVTASLGRTSRVWHTRTGAPIGPPLEHSDTVSSATFSPDGTRIVTASADGTARVWDMIDGRFMAAPLEQGGGIGPAFSQDGAHIAIGRAGRTAWIWDAKTGKSIGRPAEPVKTMESENFSPDGMIKLIASENGRIFQARNVMSGQFVGPPVEHHSFFQSVHFSPDSARIVASSSDGLARLWDLKPGQHLGSEEAENFTAFYAGARLDPQLGNLQQINFEDRVSLWRKLARTLAKRPDWRLAAEQVFPRDPKSALVSPRMTVTVREATTRLISTLMPENIQEAAAADPGHPLLQFAYATIEAVENDGRPPNATRAAWLCNYGMKHLPADLTAAELRIGAALVAEVVESLPEQKKTAIELLDRAAKLEPEDESVKALRGSLR